MEKLYRVKICKLKVIDTTCCVYQHVQEKIKEEAICIKDNDTYVNIDTNERYPYLKNRHNPIIAYENSLDSKIYVIESEPYSENDLSKNETSIIYLKAIRARKIIQMRREFEDTSKKPKIKIG